MVKILLNILLLLFIISCSNSKIQLEVADLSSTNVCVSIMLQNFIQTDSMFVEINKSKIEKFILDNQLTTICIDSLLPNTKYNFDFYSSQDSKLLGSTKIHTQDTTSHNFNWKIFEFGDHANSGLYDVSIIDSDNIWAVGEFYLNDREGKPNKECYNIAFWNGDEWKYFRQNFGKHDQLNYPLKSVFAFENKDVWFCGNEVIHWNGKIFENIPIEDIYYNRVELNKIWGKNSNDLYIVGDEGTILHYGGKTEGWTRIGCDKAFLLNNVTGNSNTDEVFVSGYTTKKSSSIFKINNQKLSLYWQEGKQNFPKYGKFIESIWCYNDYLFISSRGGGIFRKNFRLDTPAQNLLVKHGITNKVFGLDQNDIFIVGQGPMIWHFNGAKGQRLYHRLNQGLYSCDIKNNLFVGVGSRILKDNYRKAFVIIGIRN